VDLKQKDRKALITGASRGIGAAIARRLAAEGCDVILVARDRQKLEELKLTIENSTGRDVRYIVEDLSQSGGAERVAAQAGRIDFLINNAGDIPLGDIFEVKEAAWRTAWDLKVFGYIYMCREFYLRMIEQRSGVIVNIIGAAAYTKKPNYICGVAGNAALTAFTQALGSTSLVSGVRILGVAPGLTATPRLLRNVTAANETEHASRALNQADEQEAISHGDRLAKTFGLARAGRSEEVANLVAFLCSDRAEYLTGSVVTIDGGQAKI
jgi:NAD(P)-dependent dehydrogenase (short-subunit alcohol dehydrogenase family)